MGREHRDGGGGITNRRSRRAREASPNPWLSASAPPHEKPDELDEPPTPPRPALLLEPQAGVCRPAAELRLPRAPAPPGVRAWWLGVHGGAGETTLERLLPGSRAAGHAWPVPSRPEAPGPPVLLVARTHARGLHAAQAAAVEWGSGEVPVRLLGLVLVADAPNRLPRPLRDLAQLVAGGVPAVWRIPWHEPWRLGEPAEPSAAPAATRALLERLNELVPPAAPVEFRPGHARRDDPRAVQPSPQGAVNA